MKSCIEWRKGFKYLPEIDEFNIDFKNKQIKLKQFLDLYAQSQRVNIRLPKNYTPEDVDLLVSAYEHGYNIRVVVPPLPGLQKLTIPFYCSDPCWTWDQFMSCVSLGVTDVFISGDLGFELDKVSKVAKENNIQVRCYANIAQSNGWEDWSDGIKQFFIRPEDMEIYGDYVDVIEFYDSVERQNVLYEVYFKNKEWNGKLREIIQGVKNDVNNYYLLGEEFAKRRIRCERNCLKGKNCKLCDGLIELANSLEDSPDYDVFKKRGNN